MSNSQNIGSEKALKNRLEKINQKLSDTIETVKYTKADSHQNGKVRDAFVFGDKRAIVVSDRVSAFDFVLGTVPYKGAVLNQIAAWWFEELDKIGVPHHLLEIPHPNISINKNAKVLPIEIIVRGYLTGSTKTSAWYAYQNLDRKICGITLPEGMKRSQKFGTPIVTPSTKPTEAGLHDENIAPKDIVQSGLVSKEIYEKAESYALKMFAHGQKVAAEKNLILVDTKYEMGLDEKGEVIVIDEVHTPDSSRYWIADTYQERFEKGLEPEGLDKEFVREKIVKAGYNIERDENPKKYLNDTIRTEAAQKYLKLFKIMTGKELDLETQNEKDIASVLDRYL